MTLRRLNALIFLPSLLTLMAGAAQTHAAEDLFEPEFPTTRSLPAHDNQQWFWLYGFRAPNQGDSRAFLMDEQGQQLGQLSMGFWAQTLLNTKTRGEIITLETYLSRGTRGERTDAVVLYDERTLAPTREILIPPKRLNAVRPGVGAVLSEDERFLLVINYTPAQSITIVDLQQGRVVEEVETPGCSVAYPAGNRDFYAICANGSFLQLKLDDSGKVVTRRRTEPLFDAVEDFLTISASRHGNTWYFVSRQNNVYGITMDGDTIEQLGPWPLVTEPERKRGWMIAGLQHTAIHEASGLLYVLMQQGSVDEFEAPGSAVWVYDLETMDKVEKITMKEMTIAIAVSQGDEPRLYALDMHIPLNAFATFWTYLWEGEAALAEVLRQRANVFDALTGEHLLSSELLPPGFVVGVGAW